MNTKIRAIVTGATGMVGEGVLHECLQHNDVESVLVVGRKPCGVSHPKLQEIIIGDFYNLSPVESRLKGYSACFFCLGTSSVGMKEEEYFRTTYSLTMHAAETLGRLNPGMIFCYVSGYGTDSSEKGKSMWARVKGKTENDLMKLPSLQAYNFRPGYMQPTSGLKNTKGFYKFTRPLYPLLRAAFPGFYCTLRELGLAMIHATSRGYDKHILEVKDIVGLAKS
jgi:uncharacterized protein YbjT (DUF2867 family)